MTIKYKKKCAFPKCKNYVENGIGQRFCEEHTKGKLRNNNPKGYNKHKKNPKPKEELKDAMTIQEMRDDVQEKYRDLWKAKREVLSKAQRYKQAIERLFGFTQIEKEMEEEYKKLEKKLGGQ